MPRPRRAGAAALAPSRGPSGAALPLPEIQIFGGGAHAGRRVDIQDFMVVCPGAASFAEALDWTAEVYRAAGELMAEAGKLKGVADEGGYWPAFATNEEALEMLVRAIERAGFAPGRAGRDLARRRRLRVRPRTAATGSASRAASSTATGMIALLLGWLERYPIVSIEDPLAEDDPRRLRRVHARGRRARARSSATTSR